MNLLNNIYDELQDTETRLRQLDQQCSHHDISPIIGAGSGNAMINIDIKDACYSVLLHYDLDNEHIEKEYEVSHADDGARLIREDVSVLINKVRNKKIDKRRELKEKINEINKWIDELKELAQDIAPEKRENLEGNEDGK